jgi:hypothetical protein
MLSTLAKADRAEFDADQTCTSVMPLWQHFAAIGAGQVIIFLYSKSYCLDPVFVDDLLLQSGQH